MDSYIDVTIVPDLDFEIHVLLAAVYNKFHRALVELSRTDIAVSFPEYHKKGLGEKLRLLGNANALNELMASNWLHRMSDYCITQSIREIPQDHSWISVRRRQFKYRNIHKLRNRHKQRHNATDAEAEIAYPLTLQKMANLPFVLLKSQSTGQGKFPLYIEQKKLKQGEQAVAFNTYGLSSEGVIPCF